MELFDARGRPIRLAEDIRYDNAASGLTAEEVQAAIDEIAAAGAQSIFDPVPAEFADDSAASGGGVPVGGIYRTGSVLKVRVS